MLSRRYSENLTWFSNLAKSAKYCFIRFFKKKFKGIYWFLLYIFHKKTRKKNLIIFLKYEFQKLLPIKRHPKIMSFYQGGILNTWHDFKISQNRQYIVSSGFSKTNLKEYTDFYCIFSIQKNLKKSEKIS